MYHVYAAKYVPKYLFILHSSKYKYKLRIATLVVKYQSMYRHSGREQCFFVCRIFVNTWCCCEIQNHKAKHFDGKIKIWTMWTDRVGKSPPIGRAVAATTAATNASRHVRGQRCQDCATIIPGFILTSFLNNEECPHPHLMGSGWATRDPSLSHIRPQWARHQPRHRLPPSSGISHPATHPIPSRLRKSWMAPNYRPQPPFMPTCPWGIPTAVLMPEWLNSDSQDGFNVVLACWSSTAFTALSCAVQISKPVKRGWYDQGRIIRGFMVHKTGACMLAG